MVWILGFLCLAFIHRSISDTFSSVQRIQKVAEQEQILHQALGLYMNKEVSLGRHFNYSVGVFYDNVGTIHNRVGDISEFGENPINAFKLLYRVVIEWPKVYDWIQCDNCIIYDNLQTFNVTLTSTFGAFGETPTISDVHGAASGLLRLVDTYQLNVGDLIEGVIYGARVPALSYEEVLFIVDSAGKNGLYYEQVIWLSELLRLRVTSFEEIKRIKRMAALAYSNFGMPWVSVDILSEYVKSDSDTGIISDFELYKQKLEQIPEHERTKEFRHDKEAFTDLYHSLCRGNIKTEAETSKLKCFLRPTTTPFYRSREEVVNYIPRIVLFHDVITSEEIEYIKKHGEKVLARSMVDQNNPTYDEKSRVSQTGWLKDDEHPFLTRVTRRIGRITGLETTYRPLLSSVESYQTLNYGVGGMYNPHNDNMPTPLWGPPGNFESDDIKGTGDRIATWMFYLQQVKAGGATVFPKLKSRVQVVEGAAAFWYNTLPNGNMDERVQHAGCPVLLGSKWVSNKWIRQHGQVLTKKCELSENADFYIPSEFSGA